MKKIKFIRHSFLVEPYDNYDKLSFFQLCQLAKGEVEPKINPQSEALVDQKFSQKELENYDLIMIGLSNRTRQTGKLLQSKVNKKIAIKKNKLLSEIYFDPAVLTSEQKYKKNGMDEIRIALFKGILEGKGTEKLNNIFVRIEKLQKLLKKQKANKILCITHGFYMRFLQLVFLEDKNNTDVLTLEDLTKIKNYPYLEGFEVEL